ncbi:MAG: hypothetical protein EHM89_08425 [Acidobacteria bacterium]|nr:MAG: hypothetical protein EHM89_08425 [Acidobacteriota bacterium]
MERRTASRHISFRAQYMDRILHYRANLFFESGSTVAYVAKSLSERLADEVRIGDDGEPTLQICTNNVLAYLSLWLCAKVPCSPFPWSPPLETRYGAWYGGLEEKENKLPTYDQRPLDDVAKQEICKLLRHPYGPGRLNTRPTLLLGAASGLQLTPHHQPMFSIDVDEETRQRSQRLLAGCFGPHVGSYHNKVFKRFMYATRFPMVLFISSEKIDCPIHLDRCHFILDSELPWDEFRRTHPLAICVGCLDTELDHLEWLFGDAGFEVIDAGNPARFTAFIARNRAFIEQFESWSGPVAG